MTSCHVKSKGATWNQTINRGAKENRKKFNRKNEEEQNSGKGGRERGGAVSIEAVAYV